MREVPAAAKIEKPNTDKDAALPAHPGAAAYIDGTERTFMDKYSDYIWGADPAAFRAGVGQRRIAPLYQAGRTTAEHAAP